jgi:uncharacterized protein HemX
VNPLPTLFRAENTFPKATGQSTRMEGSAPGAGVWGLALVLALGVSLTGCSTTRSREDVVKDQIRAEEARAKAEAERAAQRQALMEKQASSVPKWAMQAAKPDATGLYAVGMADSEQLALALRKATLDAEFGLAKLYGQELSGSERNYTQDSSGESPRKQYTALIDKLVERVSVVGFEVVEQAVAPMEGRYHAWVMLKLPYTAFNKVLQEQRARSTDASVQAAFDDLERRLAQRQAERQADRQREQGRAAPGAQSSAATREAAGRPGVRPAQPARAQGRASHSEGPGEGSATEGGSAEPLR